MLETLTDSAGIVAITTVIPAIVSAVVAVWISQRRISIENITQDRRAWREKIRKNALLVHDALITRDKKLLDRHRAEFVALLNPNDDEDKKIVCCISSPDKGQEIERAKEFSKRIALLLKHDWERAKLEAGPLCMRIKCTRRCFSKCIYKPDRKKM